MNSDHYCRHPANMSFVCRPKSARFPHSIKQTGGGRRETGRNWEGRRSWAWWHCIIPDTWEAEAGLHHWGQGLGSKESSRLGWWLSETLGAGDVPVIKCECAGSPAFHLQHIKRSGSNWSGQRQLGSVLIKNTNILQLHSPPPPLWTGQFPCLGLLWMITLLLRRGQRHSPAEEKTPKLSWLHVAHLCAVAWQILIEQFIFQKKVLLLKDFWKK